MPLQHPAGIQEEYLEFLDALRATGAINMFGAGPYLRLEFDLDRQMGNLVLRYWMETFKQRQVLKLLDKDNPGIDIDL
jgi:hypothetical protein